MKERLHECLNPPEDVPQLEDVSQQDEVGNDLQQEDSELDEPENDSQLEDLVEADTQDESQEEVPQDYEVENDIWHRPARPQLERHKYQLVVTMPDGERISRHYVFETFIEVI